MVNHVETQIKRKVII